MALTKFNYNSFDVTSAASTALGFNANANGFATINPGSMTLIKTLTASSDSTLSFVDGSSDVVLDSTYPVYMFKFISIHGSVDFRHFTFQGNAAGGSGYNETITSTTFEAKHDESGSAASVGYESDRDQAQGTSAQIIIQGIGSDNDQSGSGELFLFNPSSTTFVKHFIARGQCSTDDNKSHILHTGGFFDTTSAIDEIQFAMSGGNIDAGTIKLYGIKDS